MCWKLICYHACRDNFDLIQLFINYCVLYYILDLFSAAGSGAYPNSQCKRGGLHPGQAKGKHKLTFNSMTRLVSYQSSLHVFSNHWV